MNNKVEIPKKFKDKLSKRFDFKKARKDRSLTGIKEIVSLCPLCEVFNAGPWGGCRGCPFRKFETEDLGCYAWINRVIPHRSFHLSDSDSIWWKESEDKEVKEQLLLLRKKAKELIEWV